MGWFLAAVVTVSFGLGLLIGYKWALSDNRNPEHDKELDEFFNSL